MCKRLRQEKAVAGARKALASRGGESTPKAGTAEPKDGAAGGGSATPKRGGIGALFPKQVELQPLPHRHDSVVQQHKGVSQYARKGACTTALMTPVSPFSFVLQFDDKKLPGLMKHKITANKLGLGVCVRSAAGDSLPSQHHSYLSCCHRLSPQQTLATIATLTLSSSASWALHLSAPI